MHAEDMRKITESAKKRLQKDADDRVSIEFDRILSIVKRQASTGVSSAIVVFNKAIFPSEENRIIQIFKDLQYKSKRTDGGTGIYLEW